MSPYQTRFIPGRTIQENIVVVQEKAHNMSKMEGKAGFFALKVDLSKDYDRLSWSFIRNVLSEVGYPEVMINVIMSSVTSVRSNVKWNGNMDEFFQPSR